MKKALLLLALTSLLWTGCTNPPPKPPDPRFRPVVVMMNGERIGPMDPVRLQYSRAVAGVEATAATEHEEATLFNLEVDEGESTGFFHPDLVGDHISFRPRTGWRFPVTLTITVWSDEGLVSTKVYTLTGPRQ